MNQKIRLDKRFGMHISVKHTFFFSFIIIIIVLDYKVREEEAYRLISDGYTNTLIIPAQKKIFNITIKGDESLLQQSIGNKNSLTPKREGNQSHRFYENTHLELIAGKSMLDSLGFTSAIFVSSPYHLRRIKKIADRVFTEKAYQLSFASPRFQKKKNLMGN